MPKGVYNKILLLLLAAFIGKTVYDFKSPSESLKQASSGYQHLQMLDRSGVPLNISYQNRWNISDVKPLYQMPDLLKKAFIISEDKRFYEHGGIDWLARASAVQSFATSGSAGRGASTITEQVVRMLHPRPRSLWSKWIETLEAIQLDSSTNKSTILEFYLNQVPYAANRKGVVQAARYYFNRSPDSLNEKETMALAVMVRAPSRYDLHKKPAGIETPIKELAAKLNIKTEGQVLELTKPQATVNAQSFVEHMKRDEKSAPYIRGGRVRTTLDANIQAKTYDLLNARLKSLKSKKVKNASALVIDHTNGEVIAWVVAGLGCEESNFENNGCKIDMVKSPRQPGSSLKPFLYATALDNGWTAATIIDDSPYSEAIGRGMHNFRNYSSVFYGDVTVRQALGNSLNIPALKAINYVGAESYLQKLHQLGFVSLDKEAAYYDEGLALGNGEVSLYELVKAYAALANKGHLREIKTAMAQEDAEGAQVFSEEAASIISNIISDPWARLWEFGGAGNVLNLPVQTAIKTGTSNDHRDAWVVGYNYKYVVGVWMGNIGREPMTDITGSTGPALVLRGVMKELVAGKTTRPLYLSPKLVMEDICIKGSVAECTTRTEYFKPGTFMAEVPQKTEPEFKIARPVPGLEMAYDPRIPADRQYFEFAVSGLKPGQQVEFILNGQSIYKGASNKFMWKLQRGKHKLKALPYDSNIVGRANEVQFTVK